MPKRFDSVGRRRTRHVDDLDLGTIAWLMSGWRFLPDPPSGWPTQWPWPPEGAYHEDRPTQWETLADLLEDYQGFRDSFLATWHAPYPGKDLPWVERQFLNWRA
jgi:hypothetical protein